MRSPHPVALPLLSIFLTAAAQECSISRGRGVCNGTAGAIFLQQHHRAHRSDAVLRVASECSSSTDDCRETGCCEDAGYTCYEKNQYWASCRQSCEPGESNPNDDPEHQTPWTCTVIGTGSSTEGTNPSPGQVLVTSTAGSGKARLFEFLAALTDQPVPNSQARAVHSSGGAAGGVVSESQGYGLLLTGTLLAASPNDPDRQKLMDHTYEMFLGWRRMCELSKDSGSCQEDEGFQCGGGQYPCLPHWKFDDDLTGIIGRGAAPDGDADALAGMLLAVLSLELTPSTARPPWLEEVGQWAYDTCKQFYLSSTVCSESCDHRIVKLGSCWGGWGNQGQNPSYHAPGVYRMCRNYMKSHDGKYGSSSAEGDDFEIRWNQLIDTTYKMFDATQCESSGLIPNWAKIFEEGQGLRAETGFSGSGTPGAEYGAEASRGVWRVALDYLLFPGEAGEAAAFLDPVAAHLETRESGGSWSEQLRVDGNCLVESIHPGWSSNMFMAGPTFTSLVSPSNSVDLARQQELIDAAGKRVASKAIDDYYSGSWVAISTVTLNGDLARAAQGAGLGKGSGTAVPTTVTTVTTGAVTTTTTTEGPRCALAEEDCRSSACCEDVGFTCYEKNEYWASCRWSCEPGEVNPNDDPDYQTPWTCAVIGGRSSSTTTAVTTTTPWVNPSPGHVFTTGSAGSGKARLFEFIAALTDQPVPNSQARAVHSSGGAAGGVVSESQGYGLLLTGALLAAMPEDQDRQKIMDYTYEMFLGWRRMCELSKDSGSCQEDEGFQCGGGQYPCLPHWKFDDDLAQIIGRGAAPDGDADALAGMLFAVLSLERTGSKPQWLEEVAQWTYETCKQFYLSSTVCSESCDHRIVKLGSCWGGWGNQGQNPSYHAPGVYRMCRDYMKSHDGKYGSSSAEGENFEIRWNQLIDTTYKMFDATQCDSNGLVPNWAQIYEEGSSLRATTGFSGSGTPGAEYGSEAARAVWRVALDFLLFPGEAGNAAAFLDPVAAHLETRESGGNWAQTLRVDGNCLVESVHPSWSWNMFMAGPTFTALVCPSNSVASERQQVLIDAAGVRVASKAIDDYYSGSWVAISTITLNGDLVKAAENSGLGSGSASTTTSTTGTTGTTGTTTTTSTTTSSAGTTTAPRSTTAGTCSSSTEDCRSTGCCEDAGYTCYEKDQYWAACRSSCEPGEVNPMDPIEYRTPWTCLQIGGTTASTTSRTTTTTTPMSLQMTFEAVDGGRDRACRGDHSTDNSDAYYTVFTASTLEECKEKCKSTSNCQGVEFKGSRCEVWTRPIRASTSLGGFTCLRYVDPNALRAGEFEMVDGEGRVCRGAAPGDNSEDYFHVIAGQSLEGCQRLCRAEKECVGVEHHEGGRCEIWTRSLGIQATSALPGYTCWRFWPEGVEMPRPREGSFEVVGGAVSGRVCRGSSPTDNLPSYFTVTTVASLDSCKNSCRMVNDCKGVEFHSSGRCELWTRDVQSFRQSDADYSCWRFVEKLDS